jgi:hypothetical protein
VDLVLDEVGRRLVDDDDVDLVRESVFESASEGQPGVTCAEDGYLHA